MSITDTDGVLLQDALESRAECPNLEALQAKRRQLVNDNASRAARFKGGSGNGSSSDAARKRHRAAVSKLILDEKFKNTNPPAETALERMANADDRHITFCEDLEKEFAKYLVIENDIAEVTEQIRDREERLRCYRAELGLQ